MCHRSPTGHVRDSGPTCYTTKTAAATGSRPQPEKRRVIETSSSDETMGDFYYSSY
jgi:hypothetical protein